MGHSEHCVFVEGLNVPGGHTTEERTQRKFFLSSSTSCLIQIYSTKSKKKKTPIPSDLWLEITPYSTFPKLSVHRKSSKDPETGICIRRGRGKQG